MRRISLICFLTVWCIGASAQDENSSFGIRSANVHFGINTVRVSSSNLSDFQKLAPEANLTESDLLGFSRNSGALENSGPSFTVNVVLAKPTSENTPKFNPEFRFGISFQESVPLNVNYNRVDEFRIDTLRSASNGEEFYVDSIHSQNYYLNYSQTQVMIDGDVTISTNPQKRWKFYTGVGFSFGVGISARTTVTYNSISRIEGRRSQSVDNFEPNLDGSYEENANKSAFFARAYIPFGVDFRIGKRKESLKKYHLFLESRQSLNFVSIPELSSSAVASNSGGLGFRYDF